ncbi:uncharacterized protein BCR38DRAFT_428521, partial [Pseudomassariella vexata]
MTIPVVPTFGNNDILPHNVMEAGPNRWLKMYSDIWKAFIPQQQLHSFEFGGWFYTEVVPNKLAVFSLNTLYFFERNGAIDDCVRPSEPGFKQMEWLRVQLQFLRSRRMKAILMGHVPPARTSSKHNWDETCWQKYTLWLQQYRDVVVGSLYGHMNIDHFFIQDTEDIDVTMLERRPKKPKKHKKKQSKGRKKQDDQLFHIDSAADYLTELREHWAKLPKAAVQTLDEVDPKKKGKKGHDKIGGKFAERYQLSLVSPSIVPNFFPTLRVFEYNITGIEDTPTWVDVQRNGGKHKYTLPTSVIEEIGVDPLDVDEEDEQELLGKDGSEFLIDKKKKGKKPKKPNDPYLVIPDPPSATEPPGPAYSLQPLTLIGYTQYFANLTHLNNDVGKRDIKTHDLQAEDDGLSTERWQPGMHKGKKPGHKPKPLNFTFDVEYSTFEDKIYKMKDLTVRSWINLAYRIGQVSAKSKALAEDFEDVEDEVEEHINESDTDEEENDNELGAEKKKNKKKKSKKKKKKHNKVWLHFLEHAFVSTQKKKNLKKL